MGENSSMSEAKRMLDVQAQTEIDRRFRLPDTLVQSLLKTSNVTDGLRKQLDALDLSHHIRTMLSQDKWLGAQTALIRATQLSQHQMFGKQYADILAATSPLISHAMQVDHSLQRHIEAINKGVSGQLMRMAQDMSTGTALKAALDIAKVWKDPFEDVRKSLQGYQAPFLGLTERALLDSLTKTDFHARLKDTDFSSVWDDLDDQLKERASDAVQTITSNASDQATPEAALQQILDAIAKTGDSKLQKLLWLIAVPMIFLLLNTVVAPIGDFYVKKWLDGTPRQEANKAVKQAAADVVGDLRSLSDYRFVGAKILILRSSPSARSPALGELHFGQTVHVVQKGNDFTLVKWSSMDGTATIQGWVFSRYLKRFE